MSKEKTDSSSKRFACIFDMNGTLVDDAKYQQLAWQALSENIGRKLSDKEFRLHVSGHKAEEALAYLVGSNLTDSEAQALIKEKQDIYRELFRPVMQEVKGLSQFLQDLREHKIPMLVATSASQATINFILDNLKLRNYFQDIIRAADVPKAKPAPDLFLRASELSKMDPKWCIVFEDSIAGLAAAKNAGMKSIGLATTLSIKELINHGADIAIVDFTEINHEILIGLFGKN